MFFVDACRIFFFDTLEFFVDLSPFEGSFIKRDPGLRTLFHLQVKYTGHSGPIRLHSRPWRGQRFWANPPWLKRLVVGIGDIGDIMRHLKVPWIQLIKVVLRIRCMQKSSVAGVLLMTF